MFIFYKCCDGLFQMKYSFTRYLNGLPKVYFVECGFNGGIIMEYESLVCHNNWGIDEWSFKSDWLNHFSDPDGNYKHGSDSNLMKQKKVDFNEGQQVRIKWPDDSESVEVVALVPYNGGGSDHGKSFSTKGKNPAIATKVQGLELLVTGKQFEKLKFARDDLTTGQEYLRLSAEIDRSRKEYAEKHGA